VAGTTTVVFTDVSESSTVLASVGDDAYARIFADHVSLLRTAAERHGGRVTKQLGDGVLAVFRVRRGRRADRGGDAAGGGARRADRE